MRRLALILMSLVAGCAESQAVNPYPVGTRQYEQWQEKEERDRHPRQARHSFMFEGHDLPQTTTPPGSVPPEDRHR